MNNATTKIYFCFILMLTACGKEKMSNDPSPLRIYSFAIGETHQIFRSGDDLHVIQTTTPHTLEVRTINTFTLDQKSRHVIYIESILNDSGIADASIIGTSQLLALTNGNYAFSCLNESENIAQLRVIILDSEFQFIHISSVVQQSVAPQSIYSAPSICQFENTICTNYGIKTKNGFDVVIHTFDLDAESNSSLGTYSFSNLSNAIMNEGATMQLAVNPTQLFAYCEISPAQFFMMDYSGETIIAAENISIEEFGITKHYNLLNYNNTIYAEAEKALFAGLVSLNGGNNIGVFDISSPELLYSDISNNEIVMSVRAEPSGVSTIARFGPNGNAIQSIQPEEIPYDSPRYIYASRENDNSYLLLGLNQENQAFIMRVDSAGKLISF